MMQNGDKVKSGYMPSTHGLEHVVMGRAGKSGLLGMRPGIFRSYGR
jgi:hypothetical protein